jgi:hypothetical protein
MPALSARLRVTPLRCRHGPAPRRPGQVRTEPRQPVKISPGHVPREESPRLRPPTGLLRPANRTDQTSRAAPDPTLRRTGRSGRGDVMESSSRAPIPLSPPWSEPVLRLRPKASAGPDPDSVGDALAGTGVILATASSQVKGYFPIHRVVHETFPLPTGIARSSTVHAQRCAHPPTGAAPAVNPPKTQTDPASECRGTRRGCARHSGALQHSVRWTAVALTGRMANA